MFTWISLFIFLCGALTPALSCDWLKRYGHLNNYSQRHIRLMGGPLTTEESPVHFPKRLYSSIRNNERLASQLVFIRDSLELILDLYDHHNISSVPWNTSQTERFLASVHRQVDGLNTCVSTTERPDRKLWRYYRNLKRSTLHRTGGSTASWEMIRRETKLHLDQLELLVYFIRKSSETTRRQP